MKEVRCPDCHETVIIPNDVFDGEVISCSCCGLELEYRDGNLVELVLKDGEDFGE